MSPRNDECVAAAWPLVRAASGESGDRPAHALHCTACTELFEEYEAVAQRLRSALRPGPTDVDCAERVVNAVRRVRRSGVPIPAWSAWATAAGLLIAVFAGGSSGRSGWAELEAIARDQSAAEELLAAFGLSHAQGAVDVALDRAENALSQLEGALGERAARFPWSGDDDWDSPPPESRDGAVLPTPANRAARSGRRRRLC